MKCFSIFCLISLLLLTGCYTAQDDEAADPQTSHTEETFIESRPSYVPVFEDICILATDIVEAKLTQYTVEGMHHFYNFEVLENLHGLGTESLITVPAEINPYYIEGNTYILLLMRYRDPISNEDSFTFVEDRLTIKVTMFDDTDFTVSQSQLYGEALTAHIGTKEFLDAFRDGSYREAMLSLVENNPPYYEKSQ